MEDVIKERVRQVELWGNQEHHPAIWMVIAQEEFGEIAEAIQKKYLTCGKESDSNNMYEEIIQTIAVLVAFADSVRKENEKT